MSFRIVPNLIVALLACLGGYSFPASAVNNEKDLKPCEGVLVPAGGDLKFEAQVEASVSGDLPTYAGRVRIMPSVTGGEATVEGEPSFLFSVKDGRQYVVWAGTSSGSSEPRMLFISRLLGMEAPVFAFPLEPGERIFGFSFVADLRKMRIFTSQRTLIVEHQ